MNADEVVKGLIDRIAELQQIFDKAWDKNQSVTPPDSLSRLCTTLITNSIQDISAACAFIKGLTAQLAASQRRAQDARNELCLKCGQYREAHKGVCDGCRWKE